MIQEINTVTEAVGKYKVTTDYGTYYLFDFNTDEAWAKGMRVPAEDRNALRADNDWFIITGIDAIKVGIPMYMQVIGLGRNDDYYTWRSTTTVTKIEKLED